MTVPFSSFKQPFYITGPDKCMFIQAKLLKGFFQTKRPPYVLTGHR